MIRASLRRPVAVSTSYAVVVLLGGFAWKNLPIELLPDAKLPRLTVSATWRGSSPETVEAFLTAPMEGTIRQLRGVENVISNSTEERAAIQVVLARDTDTDFARLELKERLSTLEEELPADVGPIEVEPYIPDEFLEHHSPFLSYRFIGPYASEALFRHADEVVRPELERLEGVGQVRLTGDTRRVVEIRIDEERLAAFGDGVPLTVEGGGSGESPC